MPDKKLPPEFMGYSTKDLLATWQEIQRPEGTTAPPEQIIAMHKLLQAYQLGVFQPRPDLTP